MLNYSATCLTEDLCDTRYSLTCVNQSSSFSNCSCLNTQYYNGSSCAPLLGYQLSCSNLAQCNSNLGLICVNSTCNCNATQFYNGSICGNFSIIL